MLSGIELGRAIEAARIKKGVSKADMARTFKVRPPSISGWIDNGRISKENFNLVMEYFADTVTPDHWGLSIKNISDQNHILISQYKTGGKGGHGLVLRDQPGIIKQWQVSHDWLRSNIPYHTSIDNLCIVTGFGDSMPDTFNSGDPILVDRGVTQCDHDGVYFFRVGDEGFIKRLLRIPGIGIRVLSQNKEYEPWTITKTMDFEVFGKVIKVWKGQNF